jgi:hypothetical protein
MLIQGLLAAENLVARHTAARYLVKGPFGERRRMTALDVAEILINRHFVLISEGHLLQTHITM